MGVPRPPYLDRNPIRCRNVTLSAVGRPPGRGGAGAGGRPGQTGQGRRGRGCGGASVGPDRVDPQPRPRFALCQPPRFRAAPPYWPALRQPGDRDAWPDPAVKRDEQRKGRVVVLVFALAVRRLGLGVLEPKEAELVWLRAAGHPWPAPPWPDG